MNVRTEGQLHLFASSVGPGYCITHAEAEGELGDDFRYRNAWQAKIEDKTHRKLWVLKVLKS